MGKNKKKKSKLIPTVKESFEAGKTQGEISIVLEALEMTKQGDINYMRAYLKGKLSMLDPVYAASINNPNIRR